MNSTIRDFWKSNERFWICKTEQIKSEADKIISEKFYNYDYEKENIIGQIIYLDQFSRHFCRNNLISEEEVIDKRAKAYNILVSAHIEEFSDEFDVVFGLMVCKHLNKYDFIFDFIHNKWLKQPGSSKMIKEYQLLHRFYIDCYKKAYTSQNIKSHINTHANANANVNTNTNANSIILKYDKETICDYYPENYSTTNTWPDTTALKLISHQLIESLSDIQLQKSEKMIVSLSGGVDSMVMLCLLRLLNRNVEAVHIVYNNRQESEEEVAFLTEYCYKLNVTLHIYKIEWLKRNQVEREFYETMTRNIRFIVYKSLTENNETTPILLGHIKEDLIENVWTNIAKCTHTEDLKKMSKDEMSMSVRIYRPFLNVDKSNIYSASRILNIPYLKNTTPSWSNRGKFRERFYSETIAQFGSSVDNKILEFADTIKAQNDLLHNFLYKPIFDSYKDEDTQSNNTQSKTIDITNIVTTELDANNWTKIFEYVCYNKLHIPRPCNKAIKEFCKRIYEKKHYNHIIPLSKYLSVMLNNINNINYTNNKYILSFITHPENKKN
jgi:tRNA(Ile)-lysidine synthetase-like protein